MASRDPDATKRRILAAALREFSAKGIAGARVDAIAARAKINKRMLYYYFGSKEGLFREILRRRLHERSPQLQSADLSSPSRLTDRQARLLGEGDYTRLLMWEALETKTKSRVDEPSRIAFFRTWVEAIEEEQRVGNLPADLDAAQLLLSEILLVLGPMILPQLTRFITGHSISDPEFERARGEFLEVLTRHIDDGTVSLSTAPSKP